MTLLTFLLIAAAPPVTQPTATTCVHAAVTSVLLHHGVPVTLDDVRRGVRSFTDGTGFFEVSRWLDEGVPELGVDARVFRASEGELRRLARSGFAPIARARSDGGQHAFVVEAVTRRHVRVMDPAEGRSVELPRGELSARRRDADDLVLLLVPRAKAPAFARIRVPHRRIRAEDARFRATGWDRLAREHGRLDGQACVLVARAAASDPTWTEGLERHLSCLRAVGDPGAAVVEEQLRRLRSRRPHPR